MSKLDDFISDIKTRQIGQTGKKALIVEGDDDVLAFQAFLVKKKADWEQSWVIAPAGNKSNVIKIMDKEPGWLGVIDRDEWVEADVLAAEQNNANLFVLPRFCIESYLIVPDEIWAALPAKQREKLTNGQADLDSAIQAQLPVWIRHAALWQVINPLYQRMRRSNDRDNILDNPHQAPDQIQLKQILQGWLDGFDPDVIASQVDAAEQTCLALPQRDVFAKHLYAKKFYPMVVHAALNQLLGQKSEKIRLQALLRTLPLPADLAPLWVKMGL